MKNRLNVKIMCLLLKSAMTEKQQTVMNLFTSKKVAFTLAEVLITLGIIGVVAAMTIPTMISNHKKQVWVTQLKKSVSTLEQGFQKMLADDEVFSLSDTEVFKSIPDRYCTSYDGSFGFCAAFYKKIRKYFNIVDIIKTPSDYKFAQLDSSIYCNYYTSDFYVIVLANGAWIFDFRFYIRSQGSHCEAIKANGGTTCEYNGYFYIDVNGKKGPNFIGRDIFMFTILSDGHLVPEGSKTYSLVKFGNDGHYWRNWEHACSHKYRFGEGCAARIIENGWVMDY